MIQKIWPILGILVNLGPTGITHVIICEMLKKELLYSFCSPFSKSEMSYAAIFMIYQNCMILFSLFVAIFMIYQNCASFLHFILFSIHELSQEEAFGKMTTSKTTIIYFSETGPRGSRVSKGV